MCAFMDGDNFQGKFGANFEVGQSLGGERLSLEGQEGCPL